jgi:trimeric autotransporter adhesin
MKKIIVFLVSSFLSLMAAFHAPAQGTAFTYQGRLNDAVGPANGIYDLRFTAYDALAAGSALGGPVTNGAVAVSNGLFIVALDFGPGVFSGAERWLEIGVRTNGSAADFTALTPRQPITATPYAIFSASSSSVSNGLLQNPIFLGTTGNTPLELFAGSQRALRLEPNTNGGPNVIGGSLVNQVDPGVIGATIGGGGVANYFGGAYPNRAASDFSTISGGAANFIAANADGAVIAGGTGNTLESGGYGSMIAGGFANLIRSNTSSSSIGGGYLNVIGPDVGYSMIGGGFGNTNGSGNAGIASGFYNRIHPAAQSSFIGGGQENTIEPNAALSSIGGGWLNIIHQGADQSAIAGGNAGKIQFGARESFIGGGFDNTIQTNAGGSVIGGGFGNSIGVNSIASTIAGGSANSISNSAPNATIAGGSGNTVTVRYATVGGGFQNLASGNLNIANGDSATVAGGYQNAAVGNNAVVAGGFVNHARGDNSAVVGGWLHTNLTGFGFIGGGQQHLIEPFSRFSVIAGGDNNTVRSNSTHSVIAGGQFNSISTNAPYATIAGGLNNSAAGSYAFAAGRRAKAMHAGAFVWADSTDADFASTTTNQFNIRATGGLRLETGASGATLNGQPILSGTVPGGNLAGIYSNAVTFNNTGNSFTGNGNGLSNVNALTLNGLASSNLWQLGGNNVRTGQFLGSTNNEALEIKVNSERAMRYVYASNGTYRAVANIIGGFSGNAVGNGVVGAVIAGGGSRGFGFTNQVLADQGTVSGGLGNVSSGSGATVGGGAYNLSSGPGAAVSGGYANLASGYTAVVAGGHNNTNTGPWATLGGGALNMVSAFYATVPGGFSNSATANYSFAAGQRANANHQGTFVWADSQDADFASSDSNQFLIRAEFTGLNRSTPLTYAEVFGIRAPVTNDYGGMYVETAGPGQPFYGYAMAGLPYVWTYVDGLDGNKWKLNHGGDRLTVTSAGNVGIGNTSPTTLLQVGAATCDGTTWNNASDRNLKENFKPVDSRAVLAKVAALSISEWNYKSQDKAVRHIGPTAQDFRAEFGVGESETTIATVDADGVALAAIQGLNQKLEEKEARIRALEDTVAELKEIIAERRLAGTLAPPKSEKH